MLVALVIASGSANVSAYMFYGNSYNSFSHSPYRMGAYSGGSYTGSILGPVYYKSRQVSPFLYDRTLVHFERDPLTDFSLQRDRNFYNYVYGRSYFY